MGLGWARQHLFPSITGKLEDRRKYLSSLFCANGIFVRCVHFSPGLLPFPHSLSSFGYDYTLPLIIRIRYNIPLPSSRIISYFDYGTAREPYGSDYGQHTWRDYVGDGWLVDVTFFSPHSRRVIKLIIRVGAGYSASQLSKRTGIIIVIQMTRRCINTRLVYSLNTSLLPVVFNNFNQVALLWFVSATSQGACIFTNDTRRIGSWMLFTSRWSSTRSIHTAWRVLGIHQGCRILHGAFYFFSTTSRRSLFTCGILDRSIKVRFVHDSPKIWESL